MIIIIDDGVMHEIFTKDEVIDILKDINLYLDSYMNEKWETLSDADKCGCATLDDWKYHVAEVTTDYIQEKINALRGEET